MKHFSGLVSELAEEIKKEGWPVLIFLEGPLGAGKTTFCQEFLEYLGVDRDSVKSPSFLKMIEHESKIGNVLHIDAYRMESSDEVAKLSLEHYLDRTHLYLVEWPKLFEEFFLKNTDLKDLLGFKKICRIKIKLSGENRIVNKYWESF